MARKEDQLHDLTHEATSPQLDKEDRTRPGGRMAENDLQATKERKVGEEMGMPYAEIRLDDGQQGDRSDDAAKTEEAFAVFPRGERVMNGASSSRASPDLNKGKGRVVEQGDISPPDKSLCDPDLNHLHLANNQSLNIDNAVAQIAPMLPPRRVTTANSATSITRRQFLNHDIALSEVAYQMKSITFNGERIPIVCQTSNGACPILSIANFLSLASSIALPRNQKEISAERLSETLAEYLIDHDKDLSILESLEGLHRGLNVDPQFTGVDQFLEGQEIMREFGCELVHGWLPSADSPEYQYFAGSDPGSVNRKSQNIFTNFEAAQLQILVNPDSLESLAINDFFNKYPTNMTPTGLQALQQHLEGGEMSVLFFNSHFSLLYKYPVSNELYTLVTDAGYIDSGDDVVWESLEVEQASQFYSADFIPRVILGESRVENAYGIRPDNENLMEHDEDALLARQIHQRENGRLQETDAAFARQVQAEEDAAIERRREEEARVRVQEDDQRRMNEYNGPEYAVQQTTPHNRRRSPSRRQSQPPHSNANHGEKDEKRKKDCLLM